MIAKAETVSGKQYKKFMFDRDFDEMLARQNAPGSHSFADGEMPEDAEDAAEAEIEEEPEPEAPTFSEEDLFRTREEGLAEGRRLGIEEASSTNDKKISAALDTMVTQADGLFKAQEEANQGLTKSALSVAAALVHKLFPALNDRTALDQIEMMLTNAVEQLVGTPQIKIIVPADMAEALHDRIEKVTMLRSLSGNLKVIGEKDMSVGDCRLEWDRGGVSRSTKEFLASLDEIVDRNLKEAGLNGPAPAPAEADADAALPAESEAAEAAAETEAAEETKDASPVDTIEEASDALRDILKD
ncbi:MAG: hypothetical protein VW268_15265 [Rhodospirillaceae bacterium]